jgi:hypothetical protein
MIRQVARRLRPGVRFEVAQRGDDGGTLVARYARGDHVAFDELAQVDACVETSSHGIQRAVAVVTSRTTSKCSRARQARQLDT